MKASVQKPNISDDLYTRHKKRQQKRRRMKIFIRCFWLCVLLSIAVMAVLFWAPFFNISDITIDGNSVVTNESITAACNQILIKGNNIYRTSMKDAKAAIESVPYVKSAQVSRKWPSVVAVHITESHAVGFAVQDGAYILFDEDYKVLSKGSERPEGAMEITGLEITKADIGSPIAVSDESKTDDLKRLVEGLENIGCFDLIRAIDITNPADVSFVYGGGITVKCGDIYNIEGKLMVFSTMLSDTDRIKPYSKGTIDLRIEGSGYYNSN